MQTSIEYVILVPLLILQIFLFPMVVSSMMGHWADSRKSMFLQETAGHIGSAIQQIYYSLNHSSILSGTLTNELGIQPLIENSPYIGNATLSRLASSSTTILDITLRLNGSSISVTTSVTLGGNVEWGNSNLDSTAAVITAAKYWNGSDYIIELDFGE
jgi:hypothetical protein